MWQLPVRVDVSRHLHIEASRERWRAQRQRTKRNFGFFFFLFFFFYSSRIRRDPPPPLSQSRLSPPPPASLTFLSEFLRVGRKLLRKERVSSQQTPSVSGRIKELDGARPEDGFRPNKITRKLHRKCTTPPRQFLLTPSDRMSRKPLVSASIRAAKQRNRGTQTHRGPERGKSKPHRTRNTSKAHHRHILHALNSSEWFLSRRGALSPKATAPPQDQQSIVYTSLVQQFPFSLFERRPQTLDMGGTGS